MVDKKEEVKEEVKADITEEIKKAVVVAASAIKAAPGTQAAKFVEYVNPKNEQLAENYVRRIKDAHGSEVAHEITIVNFDVMCPSCTRITNIQYPGATRCAACNKEIIAIDAGEKLIISNMFVLGKALADARK